jgi:ABC-type uncharacterized transport system substrate-binding protein
MKVLISLVLIVQTLFGCALCTIYSPKTSVILDIKTEKDLIKSIDVKWVLTKPFTETLKNVYDENLDNKLDEKELLTVKNIFLSYVKPKKYLSHISYGKKINKVKSNIINVKDIDVYIKNEILHIHYKIKLNYKIVKDNILYFNIEDKEQFFLIEIAKNSLSYDKQVFSEDVIDLYSVAFRIKKEFVIENKELTKEVKKKRYSKIK